MLDDGNPKTLTRQACASGARISGGDGWRGIDMRHMTQLAEARTTRRE